MRLFLFFISELLLLGLVSRSAKLELYGKPPWLLLMINAVHIGLQSTWLFATPAALAASANCSVNRVLPEFKRVIFKWPVVGEEGANFIAFAKGGRGILALHYMSL